MKPCIRLLLIVAFSGQGNRRVPRPRLCSSDCLPFVARNVGHNSLFNDCFFFPPLHSWPLTMYKLLDLGIVWLALIFNRVLRQRFFALRMTIDREIAL